MIKEQLHKKFEHIYEVTSSSIFLSMEALGGEVPFWISAYNPTQETEVNTEIHNLNKKLRNNGINPCLVNLFELSIQLVKKHIGLDKMLKVEKRKSKKKFKKALQSTINIHDRLIPAIKNKVKSEDHDLLMVHGVGATYPFIRSHTVLNNLQSTVKEIPTLMFFPGIFNGESLELFGLLKDDNYYRAFNIDKYNL